MPRWADYVDRSADRHPSEFFDHAIATIDGEAEVDLPAADLVYAQLSLPFAVERFEEAVGWALDAVRPGGWFVGQFLGPSDSWAREDWVTAVTRDEVGRLLEGFDPLDVIEEEFDSDSGAGPKHWHWFRVEARRT